MSWTISYIINGNNIFFSQVSTKNEIEKELLKLTTQIPDVDHIIIKRIWD